MTTITVRALTDVRERILHCWHGENDDNEIGSDEWTEIFIRGERTCMLERDHDGPHVYTPDDEIVIVFAAESASVEAGCEEYPRNR